ncbi:hypothetical protein HK105_208660 [Polyrhizophydium stewartii]|uniref:Uncharacterized protein n=1 Tax=Polyrhizophydium stewartii TaxID=2732419 RepID=A0ABR4MX40_9FUNG
MRRAASAAGRMIPKTQQPKPQQPKPPANPQQLLLQTQGEALPVWVQPFGQDASAVRLLTHVKPGARTTQVVETNGAAVGIQLAAPARDGEANEELVRFVADTLGIRKHQIGLVAGHKSRDKVLRIETALTPAQVHEILVGASE